MDRFGRQLKEVDGTLADGSVGVDGCIEMVDFVDCKLSTTSSVAKIVDVGCKKPTVGRTGSRQAGQLRNGRVESTHLLY